MHERQVLEPGRADITSKIADGKMTLQTVKTNTDLRDTVVWLTGCRTGRSELIAGRA